MVETPAQRIAPIPIERSDLHIGNPDCMDVINKDAEGQASTPRRGLRSGIVKPRSDRPPLTSKRRTDVPRCASRWKDPRTFDPADRARVPIAWICCTDLLAFLTVFCRFLPSAKPRRVDDDASD
jgi:hypothetical protein